MKKLLLNNEKITINDFFLHKDIKINYKIRMCLIQDIDDVYRIDQFSFKDTDFDIMYTKSDFETMITDDHHILLIYEKSKKIIAYISLNFEKDKVYLESIAVLPEFRKNNIASQLLINSFIICKYFNIILIYTYTKLFLVDFYKRFGFDVIRIVEKKYKDGSDSYVLNKKL